MNKLEIEFSDPDRFIVFLRKTRHKSFVFENDTLTIFKEQNYTGRSRTKEDFKKGSSVRIEMAVIRKIFRCLITEITHTEDASVKIKYSL